VTPTHVTTKDHVSHIAITITLATATMVPLDIHVDHKWTHVRQTRAITKGLACDTATTTTPAIATMEPVDIHAAEHQETHATPTRAATKDHACDTPTTLTPATVGMVPKDLHVEETGQIWMNSTASNTTMVNHNANRERHGFAITPSGDGPLLLYGSVNSTALLKTTGMTLQ